MFYDYDTKYNSLKVIVPHVRKIKRQNSCHYETSDNSKLTNYMKEMRLKKVGLGRNVLDLILNYVIIYITRF